MRNLNIVDPGFGIPRPGSQIGCERRGGGREGGGSDPFTCFRERGNKKQSPCMDACIHVPGMIWTCFRHDLDLIWASFRHVLGIIRTCFRHHPNMFWGSSRHVRDVFLNTFSYSFSNFEKKHSFFQNWKDKKILNQKAPTVRHGRIPLSSGVGRLSSGVSLSSGDPVLQRASEYAPPDPPFGPAGAGRVGVITRGGIVDPS